MFFVINSVLLFSVSYKGVDQHSIYTYYEHILSFQLFSNVLSELCKTTRRMAFPVAYTFQIRTTKMCSCMSKLVYGVCNTTVIQTTTRHHSK